MAFMLYEHNRTAYYAAESLLEETGKAAIVHPTGTGKSFIGFYFAHQHPKAKVVWLSPSEYIVKTQLENLEREGCGSFTNIVFVTYAKLMRMSEQEMEELKPDYCIMDEYHRCGARQWQSGVQRLIAMYPEAKLLGLSATNIRYLDNQRNMAEEIFDGNIASEITLGDAIVRNILPCPDYIISVYSYQKELSRYEARIGEITNIGLRRKAEKELEQLKRSLDQARGVDEVFRKHMRQRHGKYLVFCANKEHMEQMIGLARNWFRYIDPALHLYRVYTEYAGSDSDFNRFIGDHSDHLKLLYCINMLNEGIHLPDIDGVILIRPTVSPVIYKQQIGRALQTGKKKCPIIFDIVNNFENLYSISSIQAEMQVAIQYYRKLGKNCDVINGQFRIIDETCDSRRLFDRLQGSLSSSWETYYQAAKIYYQKHGDLLIKKDYVTKDGLSLGMWIGTQRRVRNGSVSGRLTEGQVKRLDAIGMIWDNVQELRWRRGYEYAVEYQKEHGNLDVKTDYVTKDGFPLGMWISNNRTWYRNNSRRALLNQERIAMLEAIGMIWSKNSAVWNRNIAEAEAYFSTHGNLNIAADYVTDQGIKLGLWLDTLRKARREKSGFVLSEEQITHLDRLGMCWKTHADEKWDAMYHAAEVYYEQYGNIDIPATYVTDQGEHLGRWLYYQKKNARLSSERRQKLEKLKVDFNSDSWEKRYRLAKTYYEEHGDLNIAQQYKTEEHIWLGKWIYEQKRNKKKLTEIQIRKLDEINMDWEIKSNKKYLRNAF